MERTPKFAALAAGVMVMGTGALGCGGRGMFRRELHSPFAFSDYWTLDWILLVVGILIVCLSLAYIAPHWRRDRRPPGR